MGRERSFVCEKERGFVCVREKEKLLVCDSRSATPLHTKRERTCV